MRASDAALRVLRQDFDSPCMTRARTPLGHCVYTVTVVFTYVYVCSITIHNYTYISTLAVCFRLRIYYFICDVYIALSSLNQFLSCRTQA